MSSGHEQVDREANRDADREQARRGGRQSLAGPAKNHSPFVVDFSGSSWL